jgi:hypothetical protein
MAQDFGVTTKRSSEGYAAEAWAGEDNVEGILEVPQVS